MTANQLLMQLKSITYMLTDGGIPITINGKEVNITEVTLEGEKGNYWCNIKTE